MLSKVETGNYFPELESLRGLAALMVAIGHSYIALTFSGVDMLWIIPIWSIKALDAIIAKLILCVANGTAAVNIFFIISGLVLGLSLDRDISKISQRYRHFLIKRFFRIYPAHILIVFIVCMALFIFSVRNPGTFVYSSSWYNWNYDHLPDASTILSNLFLFNSSLNHITWTLRVEVGMAFVLPVLHYISRLEKYRIGFHMIPLASFLALAIVFPDLFYIRHLYKFYFGLLIPLYLPLIEDTAWRLPRFLRKSMLPLALVLLLILPQISEIPSINELSETIGAVILIGMAMLGSIGKLLHLHMVKKLGQYSYSFYLSHFPILWFTYFALNQNDISIELINDHPLLMATGVCCFSIIAAYVTSALIYRIIERPGILFGRKLSRFYDKFISMRSQLKHEI